MKTMERNKVLFWYALYLGRETMKDEYGNLTGEYELLRSEPKPFRANISAAKGETSTSVFGESENYDKVIVMGSDAPPIDEYTVLWVDRKPVFDDNGDNLTPHDYIVKKIAKSLNSVSVAISKVNVNE